VLPFSNKLSCWRPGYGVRGAPRPARRIHGLRIGDFDLKVVGPAIRAAQATFASRTAELSLVPRSQTRDARGALLPSAPERSVAALNATMQVTTLKGGGFKAGHHVRRGAMASRRAFCWRPPGADQDDERCAKMIVRNTTDRWWHSARMRGADCAIRPGQEFSGGRHCQHEFGPRSEVIPNVVEIRSRRWTPEQGGNVTCLARPQTKAIQSAPNG